MPRLDWPVAGLCLALSCVGSVEAQTTIVPRIDTRLTYTDNVAADDEDKHDDWIAEITPGLTVTREQGYLTGRLAAQVRGQAYARDTDRNTAYLDLNSRGMFEALDNLLYVDMEGVVRRDNRSTFRGRGGNDFVAADRDNETRLFSIGPRIELGGQGRTHGTFSYRHRWFDGGGSIESREVNEWNGRVVDTLAFGPFGWGVEYERTDTRYDDGLDRRLKEESARGILIYNVSPAWRMRFIAGREWNDVAAGRRADEGGGMHGLGVDWMPSERTTLAATAIKRFFGTGYNINFSHRRPTSTWGFYANRDVESTLRGQDGSLEGLYYQQISDSLLSSVPDAAERDRQTRERLDEMGAGGWSDSFVTRNLTLARTFRATASLVGARNVLTLMAQHKDRERLGEIVVTDPLDDFATFSRIRERSASLLHSYKLSGFTSLNSSVTFLRAVGRGDARERNRRRTFQMGLVTRLGPNTVSGLQYRYQQSEGTNAYTENVVTANFGVRF